MLQNHGKCSLFESGPDNNFAAKRRQTAKKSLDAPEPAFRWSAIWTASYRQGSLEKSPPARNKLSTGNRYFWQVSVNTP
jgi:hypothetical protein